jgi:hypothetical protein
MQARSLLMSALVLAAVAVPASPAHAGGTLPPSTLEDFGQTKAKSLDDFSGRAVLMEFFAFW